MPTNPVEPEIQIRRGPSARLDVGVASGSGGGALLATSAAGPAAGLDRGRVDRGFFACGFAVAGFGFAVADVGSTGAGGGFAGFAVGGASGAALGAGLGLGLGLGAGFSRGFVMERASSAAPCEVDQ